MKHRLVSTILVDVSILHVERKHVPTYYDLGSVALRGWQTKDAIDASSLPKLNRFPSCQAGF